MPSSQEHIAEELGKDADEDVIRELIDSEIDKVNALNPDWKAIRNFRIRKTDFVKTTGMKIKRFVPENKEA